MEIHAGSDPPMWYVKSRQPDVPGVLMRSFWLVYVLFVFLGPIMASGPAWQWLVAAASIGVFLPLYVGYWAAIQRRPSDAVRYVVGIGALGFLLIPFNTGSTTFVIYSAALAPFVWTPRRTLQWMAVLAAGTTLVTWNLARIPVEARLWIIGSAVILVAMVGGGNLFYAENMRRNTRLWRAREDVEALAALAERERISRDLHDLLGHTLSVIALKSELASKLSASDPARAAEEIRDVERVSRGALSEVRAAVEGFRSRGLAGELRNGARALETVGVRLDAEGSSPTMSPRQEAVLALALREAVTNIVRHARASVCRVTLREEDGDLVLTVQDDGIGGATTAGHGLVGMHERAAALGGCVMVDGLNGTRVTVRLPVSRGENGSPA